MDNRLLGVGFVGGVLLLLAVVAPYSSWEGDGNGDGETLWDTHDPLVLTSGILVVFGVIAVVQLGIPAIGAAIPVGGILGLVVGIQHYRLLEPFGVVGYAVWLVMAGGILAIIGSYGLKES